MRVYEDTMNLHEAGLVEPAKDNGRKKARVADKLRLEIGL